MDALLSTTKSAAAESIMLAEIPLTLAALVQSVKAKLDRKDLIQCVVLGETLRSSLPSHSEVLGKATAASPSSTAASPSSSAASPSSTAASPSSTAAAAATMTDGVDISLTRILSAIMLRDPQFCLSQGGYCLYPCRPSMMARCAEVNNLFGSTLYPSAGARELPFFQYRRCFGNLAKSSVDNLAVAMQPIVGRQGVMTPGIHTAPSFSSWLDRWEQFLTRAPLRGATMNSLNHQFSLARRMEWNRHFMKPVTNGLITSPISIRSLELLLNYQGITPQRKRMPFREWLQMGLVPEASWSDRSSKELFLAVSQSRAACAELDEQRRSSDGLLHATRFPSTARSFRQFAPQLYRRETRLPANNSDASQWKWSDTMTDVRSNLSNPSEVFAFSRLVMSQPEKVKREIDVEESIDVMRSSLCDEDVMVFHTSRSVFSTTILPIVRALDKSHDAQTETRHPDREPTRRNSNPMVRQPTMPVNAIRIADVARAALWTHEYGEHHAHLWMTQYLRRFPKSVRVASGGEFVSLTK